MTQATPKTNKLVIIFLGAPGSGKGTQAKRLEKSLGTPHISTGDMLRAEVSKASELGKKVGEVLAAGKLVDDALMLDVMRSRFKMPDVSKGFILDGYPRNVAQAETLETILSEMSINNPKVLYLALPKEALVKRLVGRLSCSKCGAVFHSDFNPPKKPNVCDHCGNSPLVHRKDDNEDTAIQRLEVYETQTQPLLDYYRAKGVLHEVDASREMDWIHSALLKALQS